MPLPQQLMDDMIIKLNLISQDKLSEIKKEAKKEKISVEEVLFSKKIVTEEVLYESLAQYLDLPYINLKTITVRRDILFLIPEPIAQTHKVIAFEKSKKLLKVATTAPDDIEIFEFIQKKIGIPIEKHLTNPSGLNESLKQYRKTLQAEFQDITKDDDGLTDQKNDLSKLATDIPIVRIVDTLLEYAFYENASDVHIEPLEKEIIVRYRIDGLLRQVMTLPKEALSGIVARIKILSNLKVDEHRLPQDGRFKVQTEDYKIALRVSTIPTFDGEKLVLRVLNEQQQLKSLEHLGLQKKPLEIMKENVTRPHGMIIVSGPTGSGKTTTLYTILGILNKTEVNISTVEDPIEYRLQRINQSQVNPKIGYTFATGLRALLRQDPDIIMVGEIRDEETAEISVNAAMTGHLVLSTLHTNDAPSAIPRLKDMNIPTFLISSTVNLIVSQRLVRKICIDCIESYKVDKKTLDEINKYFDIKHILKILANEKAIVNENQKFESLLFYRGKGCKKCGNSGYKGRIGIYEILEINFKIQRLINKNASVLDIVKQAKEDNMLRLLEDGFIKAKNGITTIEEVIRVSQE